MASHQSTLTRNTYPTLVHRQKHEHFSFACSLQICLDLCIEYETNFKVLHTVPCTHISWCLHGSLMVLLGDIYMEELNQWFGIFMEKISLMFAMNF